MKILYCNIGEMNSYNGMANDSIKGGGSYSDKHEVNNFTNHNGVYYGYGQNTNQTFAISDKFGCDRNAEYVDNIWVIWVADGKIIGYYKNARVYRNLQFTPDEITKNRRHSDYNITTKYAVLIPKEERTQDSGFRGRSAWYGDEATNKRTIQYIESYESQRASFIYDVDDTTEKLVGKEKEAVVKVRVNQSKFREKLLEKFDCKCCLCGVNMPELLTASHIKPWSDSDENEKLSSDNGLLLCPNHDRLFDSGYISFDDSGNIIISSKIDESNKMFLNINSDMRINEKYFSEEMLFFIRFHRSKIFKK
ncbi:HNH endonuclease [Ruminococcus sp. NK3A76]|uniref:HNH endonuclease n=1 Tax=Ruminococcus sp. NK3A76 TaxID=877411 RepID=UPI0006894D8C|nr:HNH endonuclease [Ruminococcus sp. NK3A76]